MSVSESGVVIDYYSDILCVWAWIAQPRLDELEKQWQGHITVRHHFVDVFGDCEKKIPQSWGAEDGYEKFGEHVQHSAQPFELATVHPDLWQTIRPRSSAPAHLLLRAAALVQSEQMLARLALRIRRAFFCQALDVSSLDVLLELATEEGADTGRLQRAVYDGSAIAALMTDLRQASDLGVRGSPTWILNSGRQVLYGNVGYRILNANIEELLNNPADEASWC